MRSFLRNLIVIALFALNSLFAQLIITQFADGKQAGGGIWKSVLVVTNTTSTDTTAVLTFFQETTGGNTQSWTPPFVEGPQSTLALPAGSTVFLHTPGTASTLTQGWVSIAGGAGVEAYVIYTYLSHGLPNQDATSLGHTPTTRVLAPYDNTTGVVTAFGVANPNPVAETITAAFKSSDPTVTTGSLTIPANGHMAFVMPQQFASTANQSGLAEFSSSGTFTMIALRANSTGAFTSEPAFAESGPPIISTTGGGGGGGGGVPAGDITFAGFSIGKTTGTFGTTEIAGGLIAAYTPTAWNLPYNGQKIDKCIVFDTTFSGATYPAAPALSLDAGKMTLTGPGLVGGSIVVPEINTPGSIGPVYSAQLPSGSLVGGGTYQLAAAGGTQVEAFNASATLPANFTTNASTINSINRANPLAINWTGNGFDDVIISANGTTLSAAGTHQVVITCVVPASQGSYAVPTAALMQLPAVTGPPNGIGSLAVTTTPATNGTISSQSGTGTSLTPNLVGGGKVTYGGFAPYFSVVQSVTIQ
jgi:hypothetical protein